MKQADEPGGDPIGITFHLTPWAVWQQHHGTATYAPEGFASEGFVHCTDGEALVLDVGNRYYRTDKRPYVLLDIDLAQIAAPCKYEDPAHQYPHIFGPIERVGVVRVRHVTRMADGTFAGIGPEIGDGDA